MEHEPAKKCERGIPRKDNTPQMNQKQMWQEIDNCWKEYIAENNEIPRNSIIRKEIAESWIRSKKRGIDPFILKLEVLRPAEFKRILEEKSLLMKTALPFIEQLVALIFSNQSDFGISLADENGVILHLCGDANLVKNSRKLNIIPGAIFSEEAAGTHAGGTCIKLRAPIQITGAEHYKYMLRDGTASAAPIFYPNGDLAGSITVSTIHDIKHNKKHPHTLGLVTSIAWLIQKQLELEIKNNELKLINGLFHTTFTVTDVGYITIDAKGVILHANHSASNQLNLDPEKIIGCHYEEILGNRALIDKVLKGGRAIKDLETGIVTHDIKRNFLLSVQPVMEPGSQAINGVVTTLQPIEKINKLVTSRSGSEAQFTFEQIIGDSQKLKKIIEQAKILAKSPSNILLSGESGTGKEIFAQSIHNESRPNGPFLAINCAALPRSLVESELFGYESGAFTGAEKKGRPGKIELADGGTLFLDEIGDMPLELQPTLLRVLETKKVMRIGGQRYIPVNFRVIAATNQDLPRLVREKKFREDLYFRLSVLTIAIPPLREREQDIELLSQYFIRENCSKMGIAPRELSREACEVFEKYFWPGNVRELENTIIYAISVSQNENITLNDLPEKIWEPVRVATQTEEEPVNMLQNIDGVSGLNEMEKWESGEAAYRSAIEKKLANEMLSMSEMEKKYIQQVLKNSKNDTELASKTLGIARSTLYRKLKEYSLDN